MLIVKFHTWSVPMCSNKEILLKKLEPNLRLKRSRWPVQSTCEETACYGWIQQRDLRQQSVQGDHNGNYFDTLIVYTLDKFYIMADTWSETVLCCLLSILNIRVGDRGMI